jgi:uncharacterized protein YndB with AHSA1/START domain
MSNEQHDTSGTRAIDLDIEVPGTPEQVWEAVASGPGITAWFVPATVDGRVGGTVELDFGPGLGVETARITAWEPPRRFAVEVAGEGRPAFAMEWLVEARDGGTCVVRLINSGFGSGADWDAEYDATEAGWRLFLYNLRLYRTHFPGRPCSSVLVNGHGDGSVDGAFADLVAALGLPAEAREGERVAATAADAPPLAGVVERITPNMLTLLLERPPRASPSWPPSPPETGRPIPASTPTCSATRPARRRPGTSRPGGPGCSGTSQWPRRRPEPEAAGSPPTGPRALRPAQRLPRAAGSKPNGSSRRLAASSSASASSSAVRPSAVMVPPFMISARGQSWRA